MSWCPRQRGFVWRVGRCWTGARVRMRPVSWWPSLGSPERPCFTVSRVGRCGLAMGHRVRRRWCRRDGSEGWCVACRIGRASGAHPAAVLVHHCGLAPDRGSGRVRGHGHRRCPPVMAKSLRVTRVAEGWRGGRAVVARLGAVARGVGAVVVARPGVLASRARLPRAAPRVELVESGPVRCVIRVLQGGGGGASAVAHVTGRFLVSHV